MFERMTTWITFVALASAARAGGPAAPLPRNPGPQPGVSPAAPVQVHSSARQGLSLSVGLEMRSDDNILQLTQRNLDRLAANPGPPRFLVTTPDDAIDILRGDLRWRTRPLPRRETRLGLSANGFRYRRNDIKNWQEFTVSVRQEVTASKRHLATVDVWWGDVPGYYLGEITDADDSFIAGRRIRRSLRYAQSRTGAAFTQELAGGRVEIGLGLERVHRNYDSHFDERDNDNDQWRVSAGWRPFHRWGLVARLNYLAGSLDARGDLVSSSIRDADISYEHHGLGASLGVPWKRGAWRGRADVDWMPERRAYTTTDKFDVSRFGRVSHRNEVDIKVTQDLWGPLDLIASYQRLTSDASFPAGIVFASDTTDFAQTHYGLMLRGRWDFLRR